MKNTEKIPIVTWSCLRGATTEMFSAFNLYLNNLSPAKSFILWMLSHQRPVRRLKACMGNQLIGVFTVTTSAARDQSILLTLHILQDLKCSEHMRYICFICACVVYGVHRFKGATKTTRSVRGRFNKPRIYMHGQVCGQNHFCQKLTKATVYALKHIKTVHFVIRPGSVTGTGQEVVKGRGTTTFHISSANKKLSIISRF